jgi:hypothetical protein
MKIALALLLSVSMLLAQNATDTPDAHVALAKTAAGEDYQNLFNFMCAAPAQRGGGGAGGGAPRGQGGGGGAAGGGGGQRAAGGGGGQRGAPDRSTWYAQPVKVADNLYFVGQSEYSVWAITTSEGIIVLDAIYDYSIEEEVDGGLKKLGLDPRSSATLIPTITPAANSFKRNTVRRSTCPPPTGMCSIERTVRNPTATSLRLTARNSPSATQQSRCI